MLGSAAKRAPPAPAPTTPTAHQINPLPLHPHELAEWIETDSIDGEVSNLVQAGQSGRSRRCCRNSTSSGYSSHSPPLSAASYNVVGQLAKGLAVIREGEIIPRPIWPARPDSTGEQSPTDTVSSDAERDANHRQPSLYGSAGYRSSGSSGGASEYGPNSCGSTRELLLELSRTLSSVLDGHCPKSDEEVLRDITRTVASIDSKPRSIYEEIYRNTSLASSGKESTSTIGVNPINSRLYGHRCYCERKSFLCQSHPSSSQQASPKSEGRSERCAPSVFLLPDEHGKSSFPESVKDPTACSCKAYQNTCNVTQGELGLDKNFAKKQTRGQSDSRGQKDARFNYPSIVEHEYTTLECSDESSSSEGVTDSVKGNTWCKEFRGFDRNLDFTLDGLGAERLGRNIARSKRRRQYCRVIIVILCLVIFILIVIIVSLWVTRGRKVFGSM